MPQRVLLISANRCTAPEPVFPLGLSHLNAALRAAGHDCLCVDPLVEDLSLPDVLREFRPHIAGISIRNIDDVVILRKETFFGDAIELCRTAREIAKCPVVLGGSGFSIFPRELLQLTQADFGITGEGEGPFTELVNCLESGRSLSHIPGLYQFRDGKVIFAGSSCGIKNGEVVLPDRPANLTEWYRKTSGVLNLQTQRGCAFKCIYCTYPVIEGRHARHRAAERVADDFEVVARTGTRHAFIVDSVFNTSSRHVKDICEAVIRRGVKLSWGCFLRPHGLTPEVMSLMAEAGLSHIEFGCDSFCDEVLDAYGKGFKFSDILHSARLAKEAGVDACFFLIAGGPGETMETLRIGFENSRQLGFAAILTVVGMRIYPGTPLYSRTLREGRIRAGTNLLEPHYYLAEGLDVESVFKALKEQSRQSPNWIVGDADPTYLKLVSRLRQRGVVGPLWSYFSAIQRLWPVGVPSNPPP